MNQNRMPLVEALNTFTSKRAVSFHVPGHKNGLLDPSGFFGKIGPYDVTELTSLDDLHAPEGPIKESMLLLRSHYGSAASYFLVNGTTVGNLAMVLATCEPGDTVFVASNCHKSVIHACTLCRVKPIFLHPEIHPESLTPVGISTKVLKEAIERYPEGKALVVTYPTYYGHTNDMKALISIAQENEVLVLVDEAHGAHLCVGSPFPESALSAGADIVVQSAHKTLPAMTMGSYLHIGSSRVDQLKIENMLGMLQSSSPSYPIMASLDGARAYAASFKKEDIEYFTSQREAFLEELRSNSSVHVIESDDPLKLIIRIEGLSGFEVQRKLESREIFVELADPLQVLLILPLLKTGVSYKDFYSRTVQAVEQISSEVRIVFEDPGVFSNAKEIEWIKELAIPLDQVGQAPAKWIEIENSAGKIAAASIIPYPPGVPFIIAGEMITKEKVARLISWKGKGLRFQGEQQVDKGKIKIVQIMEERNE